jgi:glutathione S-transferase
MIKLVQFPPYFGLPNASPFCLKMETYLRMVDLPYETVGIPDPRKAPKGKVPYIDDDGTLVADSHFIVDHIARKYGKRLDTHLTDEQRAAAHALRVMIEEHLYFATVYSRFVDDRNWPTSKREFFGGLPPIVRSLAPPLIRRQTVKQVYAQGTGRHAAEEIYRGAGDDVRALSVALGDKPFFTGDKPVELDAAAYGLLAQVFWTPSNPDLKAQCASLKNLERFCERVRDRYFGAPGAAGAAG